MAGQNPYYGGGGGYYQQPQPGGQQIPSYPQPQPTTAQQAAQAAQAQYAISQGMLPLEQSYIENILRLNKGKPATVYMTYERGSQMGTQKYAGIIEAAGRDHIVISDPTTGKRYLLLMVYLDYVEFPGEINYLPQVPTATYPPR